MTDYTNYQFSKRPGLPPTGEPGQFFGFDGRGASYVLSWQDEKNAWVAAGFVTTAGKVLPVAYLLEGAHAALIVAWAFAPAMWPASPTRVVTARAVPWEPNQVGVALTYADGWEQAMPLEADISSK